MLFYYVRNFLLSAINFIIPLNKQKNLFYCQIPLYFPGQSKDILAKNVPNNFPDAPARNATGETTNSCNDIDYESGHAYNLGW